MSNKEIAIATGVIVFIALMLWGVESTMCESPCV